MANLRAFRSGCNVLAYEKIGIRYAMVCAWAMMLDYDAIAMLIGSQSETGKHLAIGDKVGVSALADGQRDYALQIGEGHSSNKDKLLGIPYENDHGLILVKGSKVMMKGEVSDIFDMNGDSLVMLHVDSYINDDKVDFLALEDVL